MNEVLIEVLYQNECQKAHELYMATLQEAWNKRCERMSKSKEVISDE